jgi:alkanesulfonate monooxygenase SsuD/methylene tetrahydromethanopterin reductase-like flavin-dependent oxidoreductase (luciferase family)
VLHALRYAVVGGRETARQKLDEFISMTGADELMLTAQIYEHAARLRSFEIAASLL